MLTDRFLAVGTFNRHPVLERERVSLHVGHPLNQLQERCYARHVRRLYAIVGRGWDTYRIRYLDGREETARLKRGEVFPVIRRRWHGQLDTYRVCTILPTSPACSFSKKHYPFVPALSEFLYLKDLTDAKDMYPSKQGR